MPHAQIISLATALPPHKVLQSDVRDLVRNLFSGEYKGIDRLLPVFENTQIESRYFSKPLEWFATQQTFVDSSAAFVETALSLITEASETLLSNATIDSKGINRNDIAMVIAVSTTGISTPSLDAKLIQALHLPNTTKRIPVWGLGCAGGVSGLARASELVCTLPKGKFALMVGVELCSLTFQRNDISKSNIIAASLFGDGAAAVLLKNDDAHNDVSEGVSVLASHSYLFDDSEDIMGWDIIETGLKVRFSRDIPALIRNNLPALLHGACTEWGIEQRAIKHYVVHAGGAKVLQAYSESLNLSHEQLQTAHHVLRHHGNMSSVSVLFALKEFLDTTPKTGELGIMMALGPGFSAEFLLFRH
jgi:alkylresorcinol/alkylpyrone synthase